MSQVHRQYRLVSKQLDRLKKKIAEASESSGVELDEHTHDDFKNMITSSNGSAFFESLPKDSFQYVFWQQQLEAASKKKAQNMRWHPLMIRWCLYLRHRYIKDSCIHCNIIIITVGQVVHMRHYGILVV